MFGQARTSLVVARAAGIISYNPKRSRPAAFAANGRQYSALDPCLERRSSAAIHCWTRVQRDPCDRANLDRILNPARTSTRNTANQCALDGRIITNLAAHAR
jgi:hypothetical protein